MASPERVDSLLTKYEISKEECDKQITDKDRVKISRSCDFPHGELSSCLEVSAQDIKHDGTSEYERRVALLEKWNQYEGSDATYRALIAALLEIQDKNHAEMICKLLKTSKSATPHSHVPSAGNSQ